MKKYLYIMKSELMSAMQYTSNILTGMFGYFVLILILFNLWDYIYSDPSELINGYTKSQMIWYIIVTEILYKAVSGRKLSRKISNDVKGGNITYNMNKPYSYVSYILFSQLGRIIPALIVYAPFGIITGIIFLKSFPTQTVLGILIVLISAIFSMIIDVLFITFLGLFSFYMEDAHPLFWLYSKMNLILGTIFPVEFFPKGIQWIVKISPVYVICYGPAKLFVDFSYDKAINILLAQIMYIFISYGLCTALYSKGVKKLNVNGG